MTAPHANDDSFDSHSLAHRVARALARVKRLSVRSVTYHPRRYETHPTATLALSNSTWCVLHDAWGTTPTTGRGCLDVDIIVKTGDTTTGSQLETLATMRLNANAYPDINMHTWENWVRSVITDTLADTTRVLGVAIA